jgi:asparagine N-glycosylation enzyme membrane subunit Stt3
VCVCVCAGKRIHCGVCRVASSDGSRFITASPSTVCLWLLLWQRHGRGRRRSGDGAGVVGERGKRRRGEGEEEEAGAGCVYVHGGWELMLLLATWRGSALVLGLLLPSVVVTVVGRARNPTDPVMAAALIGFFFGFFFSFAVFFFFFYFSSSSPIKTRRTILGTCVGGWHRNSFGL